MFVTEATVLRHGGLHTKHGSVNEKKNNFIFLPVVYQLNQIKKIIQFGKNSLSKKPFHKILPSPSTALKIQSTI